jgi:hypothetical protein
VDVCELVGAKYPAAPLGIMTVAALLPQQWEFKLIDENVEPVLDEHFEWADIICTGGMLPQQTNILSVIEKAHMYDCPVAVGGPDPTSQPELYRSADYLVLGEGEITIPMFLQDLANGITSGEYKSDEMADMTKAVIPRYDLIRFKDYIQVGVQYSRGCPYTCEFCDIIELYGRIPRTKTTQHVLKELQTLYNLGHRGHIDFVDDNFIGNKKNVKKALPVIKEWMVKHRHPFYFTTEASINLASDEQLLKMMNALDFRFVFIGIETPERDVLEFTKKKINLDKPISEAVKKISSYGMVVNAGFIIGFDNESDNIADNMINCIQESRICMAMLGRMYAIPNTQLTRRLQNEGRLFKNSSKITDLNTIIDQTTIGLNFKTIKPRLQILNDYVRVIRYIYDPTNYYERVTQTGLMIKPANRYRPSVKKIIKMIEVFFKLCYKLGFSKNTGWLYWKMLITLIFKNPKGIESAMNLAAMYIHFYEQSRHIIQKSTEEIKKVELYGEEEYEKMMLGKESILEHVSL